MRRSHTRVAIGAIALVMIGVMESPSAGQGQRSGDGTPDSVSRRVRLRGTDDPIPVAGSEVNVRDKGAVTSPQAPMPMPKGGAPTCAVTIDNRTALIARTFIDNQFAGTIRPLAELSTDISTGTAMLYARAEFDDGSVDVWGPIRINCRVKYLWRLAD